MRQKRRKFMCVKVVIMCLALVFVSGCRDDSEVEFTKIETEEVIEEEPVHVETKEDENIEETKEIYVFVCGEVRNPGVYKLDDGNRITHALLAAGGMTDQAAETYLNQAEFLADGQKIYVPDKEEVKQLECVEASVETEASDGKVNINAADKSELTSLSGIGASRAEAIIAYREKNGKFASIEDVKKVDGIKDGIFEKIREQIKVE